MKRKLLIVVLAAVLCLLAAVPAMAADTFAFAERSIRVFEDEEVTLALRQAPNSLQVDSCEGSQHILSRNSSK